MELPAGRLDRPRKGIAANLLREAKDSGAVGT
jgi:hypothetical protein